MSMILVKPRARTLGLWPGMPSGASTRRGGNTATILLWPLRSTLSRSWRAASAMASGGLFALLGAAVAAPPKAVTAASASRQATTPARRIVRPGWAIAACCVVRLRGLLWDATAVTTTRARSRPRSGGRVPSALAELALPALTVVSGLQLLRLMVSTVVSVYRDRLGAPLAGLALFALVVVGLGFLAPPAARLLGRRRLLVVSAAGVAGVRLVLQLVPDAVARWLLAALGVVLFLWFVPAWLARDGRGFGLALLVGLALDSALAGLGGSWDYAWSIDGRTIALAAVLAGAALWALAALAGPVPARPGLAERGLAAVVPLAGIGPALFLHALVWQNVGWQAVFGGRSPALAFLLVMAANLAALAAGTATALAGEV